MLASEVISSTIHPVLERGLKLGLLVALLSFAVPATTSVAVPTRWDARLQPEVLSPAGQVSVITVNARQLPILDVGHFRRMLGLTVALRNRPPAWDGGANGAVTAPDVIIIQEMSESNLEILNKLLKQRSDYKYELLVAAGSSTKFLVNLDTIAIRGELETWTDPCFPGTPEKGPRTYQLAHLTEMTSGLPFTVAGVHFFKTYNGTGLERCRERNTEELRAQLADVSDPVIAGGDFNYRAKTTVRECDPNEDSEPTEWWASMTAPADGGRAYVDAVYETSRRDGTSLIDEWTHEQDAAKPLCTGATSHKRGRIDYLFASGAAVAEAHADHPGWAGEEPGTVDPENEKYSDHRFVWGRFALAGPPAPRPVSAVLERGGDITVSWTAVEGAARYLIYRAEDEDQYSLLTEVDAATLSYVDQSGANGSTYRYAVAAVDQAGIQGVEGESSPVLIDARGPKVKRVEPARGAQGVARSVTIEVTFDEEIDSDSVDNQTIELSRNGDTVRGRLEQVSAKRLRFDPSERLKKNKTYKITVDAVRDALGNRGKRFTSTFTTGS